MIHVYQERRSKLRTSRMVPQVSKQSTQGVVGSCTLYLVNQGREARPGNELEQSRHSVQVMPLESNQPRETPDAIAAEISAEVGEPCKQYRCRLYDRSGIFVMCHVCFPRPRTLGRLSDEQHTRLRALFPRNGARLQWAATRCEYFSC